MMTDISNSKIKTYKSYRPSGSNTLYFSYELYYHNDGRINFWLLGNNDSTIYQYSTGQVRENNTIYYLNARGLADSSKNLQSPGYAKIYTYDAGDRLIKVYYTDGYSSDSIIYIYQNGNLISKQEGFKTTTYTYYTDKINTGANKNLGILFLGNSSVNLISTESKYIGGSAPTVFTPRYYFDDMDRVAAYVTRNDSQVFTYY